MISGSWAVLYLGIFAWHVHAPPLPEAEPLQEKIERKALRFWIDEFPFSEGETTILREQIQRSDGAALLAGETRKDTLFANKGYYVPDQWDVYWTTRKACHKAFPHMRAGQRVNCVPGLEQLTDKYNLIVTLLFYFGEGGFRICPPSYLLPDDYWRWRMHLARQGPASLQVPWVLKDKGHRGAGVHVMEAGRAVREARSRTAYGTLQHDFLQQFQLDQLTIHNRRFYIRVWLLLTSVEPIRAYVHEGGLVVFGHELPPSPIMGGAARPVSTDDFIVNHWGKNRDTAPVWTLHDLATYLDSDLGGPATFESVWWAIKKSLGMTFAVAQPSLAQKAREAGARPNAGFALMGADFLLTADLSPVLLEINSLPSLARKDFGSGGQSSAPIGFDQQKERMVEGLVTLLLEMSGNHSSPTVLFQNRNCPRGKGCIFRQCRIWYRTLKPLPRRSRGDSPGRVQGGFGRAW
eukprot:jgi/Botrbrau1/20964/Bobra.0135s0082.1